MINDNQVQLELSVARRWWRDGDFSRALLHLGFAKYYFFQEDKAPHRRTHWVVLLWELLKYGIRLASHNCPLKLKWFSIAWHWKWSITWRWVFAINKHYSGHRLGFHKIRMDQGRAWFIVWNTRLLDFMFQSQPNMPRKGVRKMDGLSKAIQQDGSLYLNGDGYISWNIGDEEITVDGRYTPEQLEFIAMHVRTVWSGSGVKETKMDYRVRLCIQILSHAFYQKDMKASEAKSATAVFFEEEIISKAISILTGKAGDV